MNRLLFPLVVLSTLIVGASTSSCVCCSPKQQKRAEKAVCDMKKDVDKKASEIKKEIKKETKKK